MSLKCPTPCDHDLVCPYDAQNSGDCEYWCGEIESQDCPPEEDFEDCEDLEDLFDYLTSDPQDYHDRHIDPYKEWSD